jgi:hypothetical protein
MAATGFTWVYNLSGGAPTIKDLIVKASEVISKGELCSIDTGEVDAAATNDTTLLGAAVEACDNTADGLLVKVITNIDAVYEVTDANAREIGATLDIGSGGLTVASSSNVDLIVVEKSSATQPTRVRIVPGEHVYGA